MSEKKGPFEAALFALRQTLQSHGCTRRLWERIQGYTGVEDGDIIKIKAKMNDIRIAIRVLKAAGNLTVEDRAWLEAMVDQHIAEYTPVFVSVCPGKAKKERFHALLESLPGRTRRRIE